MADVSVRPATVADAAELGRIQVVTWQWGYREVLPAAVLASVTADAATAAWQAAVAAPPTPRHRVLVALEGEQLVGFAAAGPADPDEPAAEGQPLDPGATLAVATFLVEPRWQRRGHGSRLMAATVDLARDESPGGAIAWIPEADTVSREFLIGAGWGPDGLARALDTGAGELREVRLRTTFHDAPA